MADESRTIEFKLKTTAEGKGSEEAAKRAEELKKRFDELAKTLMEVSKDGAYVRTRAIIPLSAELEELKQEAKAAGIAVEGFDKAALALEKAGTNAARVSVEMEDLSKSLELQQAKMKGTSDLWENGATRLARVGNGLKTLGGTFMGGYAKGVEIAKEAGVDFTESLAVMHEWIRKGAVAINTAIVKSLEFLTGKLAKVAEFFHMDSMKDWLKDLSSGLDGLAEADAKRKKDHELAAKALAEDILLTSIRIKQIENEQLAHGKNTKNIKELAAAKEHLARIEQKSTEEIRSEGLQAEDELRQRKAANMAAEEQEFELGVALRKKTIADVKKATAMKLAQAKVERKTDAELRVISKQGEIDLREFKVAQWEAEQAEWEKMQAKHAEIEAATAEKSKAILESVKTVAMSQVDSELAHLKATNLLTVEEFIKLTQEKIRLAKLGAKAGIEADEQERVSTQELTDAQTEMEKSVANNRAQLAGEVANAVLSIAGDVFGQSKELSVAKAIVDTYVAANNALSQGDSYTGAVRAAIAIAMGLMNVNKILSAPEPDTKETKVPSFDDPVNDALARRAGRKSAIDLVNHTTGAFREQLASGQSQRMAGNTTGPSVSNGDMRSAGPTINVYGSGPTQEVTRTLKRSLLKYDQRVEINVRGNRSKRVF